MCMCTLLSRLIIIIKYKNIKQKINKLLQAKERKRENKRYSLLSLLR